MILEAIFNGEIYPAETVVPKSEKFRKVGQAIADTMRYFEQTLSKEDYAKLDKLNDLFADCQTMQTEEHFEYTFVWRGTLNYHLVGLLDTIDALYTRSLFGLPLFSIILLGRYRGSNAGLCVWLNFCSIWSEVFLKKLQRVQIMI